MTAPIFLMNQVFGALAAFGDRYAVELLPDGDGILVDLESGSYFKLNATAALICDVLSSAETIGDAIGCVAEKMRVPSAEGARLIALVGETLSEGTTPAEAPGPLRYVSGKDGSAVFEEDHRTIFSIASGSRSVRFHASLDELEAPLVLYLKALVPKLLSLLEVPVLHAAACRVGGSLLAFSGKSGAGKTTTVRAFERAGASLLSEDLMVLSLTDELPSMYTAGEKFAHDWARAAAPRLEKAPEEEMDFADLSDAQQGATVQLASIWFIDAARRAGDDLQVRRLSIGDGALALLGNGMLATSYPRHWRDLLRRSRFIAERTSLSQATMPDGLSRLEGAANRYIVNSAS